MLTPLTSADAHRPMLRRPPPPRADGQAGGETPPPEKGFLQKYWYCECSVAGTTSSIRVTNNPPRSTDILPVLVLLALPSEPPAGDGEAATGAGARRIT